MGFIGILFIFGLLISVSLLSLVACWSGGLFFLDGATTELLLLLSLFTFWFVYFTECSLLINRLCLVLVSLSYLFFTFASLFYMFIVLEASMLPLLFLALGFGSQSEKVQASYYLVMFSVICGSPFLFFYATQCFGGLYPFLTWGFLFSTELLIGCSLVFLIKFPIYLFHVWLPKLHVESPSSSSILLASLLLKMGTFGFSRLLVGFGWVLFSLFWVFSLLGLCLVSLFCCFLSDINSLVAYSSVSHINLLLLAFLSGSSLGKGATAFLMLSHGLVSIFLFYLVGEIYAYWGTRLSYHASGLSSVLFFLSIFFIVGFMANAGMPPFLGLFSEISSMGVLYAYSSMLSGLLFFYFFLTLYYCVLLSLTLVVGSSSGPVSFFTFYSLLVLLIGFFISTLL